MMYVFTGDEMDRLSAIVQGNSPTKWADFYAEILSIISTASDDEVPAGVRAWFEGAESINRGVGAASAFIRDYTIAQIEARTGAEVTDPNLMQTASDAIADAVWQSIVQSGALPTLDDIGEQDALGALRTLEQFGFPRDDGIWTGNLLFVGLGDNSFFTNTLVPAGSNSSYELVAAAHAAQIAGYDNLIGSLASFSSIASLWANLGNAIDAHSAMSDFLDRLYGNFSPTAIGAFVGQAAVDTKGASGSTLDPNNSGNDVIHADGGNDSIIATLGTDLIDGGSDHDGVSFERLSTEYGGNIQMALHVFDYADSAVPFSAIVYAGENAENRTVLFDVEQVSLGVNDDTAMFAGPSSLRAIDGGDHDVGDTLSFEELIAGVRIDLLAAASGGAPAVFVASGAYTGSEWSIEFQNFEMIKLTQYDDRVNISPEFLEEQGITIDALGGEEASLEDQGDTLDFSALDQGGTFDLELQEFTVGGQALNAVGFENIIGTSGNDQILTNATANRLAGGGGQDTFTVRSYAEDYWDPRGWGDGPNIIWGGSDEDIYHFDGFDYSEEGSALGVLVINVPEMSKDLLHKFRVEDLGLDRQIEWSEISAIIINPDSYDKIRFTADLGDGVYLDHILNITDSFEEDSWGTVYYEHRYGEAWYESEIYWEDSILMPGKRLPIEAEGFFGTSDGVPVRAYPDYAGPLSVGEPEVSGFYLIGGDLRGTQLSGTGEGSITLHLANPDAAIQSGGAGRDRFVSGETANAYSGGGGRDSVSYARSTGAVTINLTSGQSSGAHAEGDTFSGIEEISGSAHADHLTGDQLANELSGNAGDDTIDGAGGDDWLSGDDGDDWIMGGDGHDMLLGGAGQDTIHGGLGDDWVTSGDGNDTLDGGAGDDTIEFDGENSRYRIDLVQGTATRELLEIIYNSAEEPIDEIIQGTETDVIASFEIIIGSNGDDVIIGSDAAETFRLRDGNDSLDAGGGDDLIMLEGYGAKALKGGAGDDIFLAGYYSSEVTTFDGGAGFDRVEGERHLFLGGAPTFISIEEVVVHGGEIQGSYQDDVLDFSGVGVIRDTTDVDPPWIKADFGNDIVTGSAGSDWIDGEQGDDIIAGGTGDDRLEGGAGDDAIYGDSGDDEISGESGRDRLVGGLGDDLLSGGGHADILEGGGGADVLIGGLGADLFVFRDGFGEDHLHDFETGLDKLDFSRHSGISSFADLTIATIDGNAIVSDVHGNRLVILNTDAAALSAEDFILAADLELAKAVNVGGAALSATEYGIDFEADPGPSSGGISARNISTPIAGTVTDGLFQSYIFGETFSYDVALENGIYLVELYLLEPWATSSGKRVFDVSLEGLAPRSFDDIDIFATVGHDTAMVVSAEVIVADGILDLDFAGSINNATVSAFAIYEMIDPTPNSAPIMHPVGDVTVDEGQVATFSAYATDADGQTPALSVMVTRDSDGTAVDPAEYSFIDNGDGSGDFSWTTYSTDAGSYSVVVTADDGIEQTTTNLSLTVNDVPAPVRGDLAKAVNVAGGALSATEFGIDFETDPGPSSGNTSARNISDAIAGTETDGLFQSYRFGEAFSYDVTLENGTYLVELYLVEAWMTSIDERVFDVSLEGQTPSAFDDIDIFAAVGHDAAMIVTAEVDVADGVLDLDFTGSTDNAIVSAFAIYEMDAL